MKMVGLIAMVLLVIGGINWGLVGAFDLDIVAKVFGAGTMITRIVYMAVGVSALFSLYQFRCTDGSCKM